MCQGNWNKERRFQNAMIKNRNKIIEFLHTGFVCRLITKKLIKESEKIDLQIKKA